MSQKGGDHTYTGRQDVIEHTLTVELKSDVSTSPHCNGAACTDRVVQISHHLSP